MLPQRLHTFSKVLAMSALSSCLPVMAQEKNGWPYDSLGSKSDARPSISPSSKQKVVGNPETTPARSDCTPSRRAYFYRRYYQPRYYFGTIVAGELLRVGLGGYGGW